MGLLNWLGFGAYHGPTVPVALLVSSDLQGCKDVISKVTAKLDPNLKISAVLYDTHEGTEAFEAASNVSMTACVGKDGACACACHGEGIKKVDEAVRHALRIDSPQLLIMQVNAGMSSQQVFGDLKKLSKGGVINVISVTTIFRAVSALNELRDLSGDAATYARAANQILITRTGEAPSGVADALATRLTQIAPKAPTHQAPQKIADIVHEQISVGL
jgi:hypothetical protein